jgi:hypothetical protein
MPRPTNRKKIMQNDSPRQIGGGFQVIDRIMRTMLGRALTEDQAKNLWIEVADHLLQKDLRETVDEAETSTNGRLDTLPRGDVLDAVAKVIAHRSWPCNMDSNEVSDRFAKAMGAGLSERNYKVLDDEAAKDARP